ncbi:MAG: hypothetical protein ACF8Q5_03630 [Phycisphaerales bacterium JB040]
MHTTHTPQTVDARLSALERSARRWRFAALALAGVVVAAGVAGFAGQPGQSAPERRLGVDVQKDGFAVVQTQSGEFRVIYEAGQNVYRMAAPSD